jgi:hypothetical protein
MKYGVFWDVTPSGSCKNRRFGGTYSFHHQSYKNRRASNNVAVTSSSYLADSCHPDDRSNTFLRNIFHPWHSLDTRLSGTQSRSILWTEIPYLCWDQKPGPTARSPLPYLLTGITSSATMFTQHEMNMYGSVEV